VNLEKQAKMLALYQNNNTTNNNTQIKQKTKTKTANVTI
jgi:hypothetical protein